MPQARRLIELGLAAEKAQLRDEGHAETDKHDAA